MCVLHVVHVHVCGTGMVYEAVWYILEGMIWYGVAFSGLLVLSYLMSTFNRPPRTM